MIQVVSMLIVPVVAMTKRKEIGLKAALFLGLYNIVPIIIDISVIFGAVSLILVVTVLQNERIIEAERNRKQAELDEVKRTLNMVFSLADDYIP